MTTKNIMIVGVGGQGTLLTSRILGKITLEAGFDVKLSEVHGMAQRGGSVVTFVRYGEEVNEPIVEEGCCDILIAFERLEAQRYAHFLKKDGVIIVNDERIDPMPVVIGAATYPEGIIEELESKYKVLKIDAMSEAKKLGNARTFNIIVLGLAAKHMDFKKEDWLRAIENTVPPKTIDINKQAFERGYSLA
ncbi:MAG: indolepyruvate oxidoreductase subunit beta [Lachnospiraceae bacterium]|nr:indolepyruvate oxidoreductase subunit beta [Lachnospiraceae bacterium]